MMTEQTDTTATNESSERPVVVRVAQLTDVGRVRTENQDFSILSTAEDEVDRNKGRLMVVADGMGGHRGGATASRMAATIIKEEYFRDTNPDITSSLRRALERANARIFGESQINPELRGMGTTCSALVVRDREAYFAHVGDSRIYLVRNGEIRQITDDHSLVASMVREGLLTSQEAEVHPRRNVLQRSMGVGQNVEIDTHAGLEVQPGDTFILCSDGLHGLVKSDEMLEVTRLPINDAAAEFVRRAMERGAPDNVTVIVGRVEETTAQELETEAAAAREARGRRTEELKIGAPTEEISLSDMARATLAEGESQVPTVKISAITEDEAPAKSDFDDTAPTLKLQPLGSEAPAVPASSNLSQSDVVTDKVPMMTDDAPVVPRPAAARGGSTPAERESPAGWIVVLLIVAALVAAAIYFLR